MADTPLITRSHIDATGWWIAASLIEDGCDPDWVRNVMREKGHGEIDLDQARRWLAAGGTRCLCAECEQQWSRQVMAVVPVQGSLF